MFITQLVDLQRNISQVPLTSIASIEIYRAGNRASFLWSPATESPEKSCAAQTSARNGDGAFGYATFHKSVARKYLYRAQEVREGCLIL